jgi:hypothetical protein
MYNCNKEYDMSIHARKIEHRLEWICRSAVYRRAKTGN